MLDRFKAAWNALARGAVPNIDYLNLYDGKLVKQHANLRRVDVIPTDPRLPPMSNIPLLVGLPGAEVVLTPGHDVRIGWSNGWPDRPYACLWDAAPGGNTPLRVALHAGKVELADNTTANEGVLTGMSKDPFTGLPHWMLGNASTKVGAKK
jgi:hypothetical protein